MGLGSGGGQCDDHADHLTEEERRRTSAYQQLLETMELSGEEEYKHLEKYANFEDNNVSNSRRNLAVIFWAMQRFWPEEQAENFKWGLLAFFLKFQDRNSDFTIDHIYSLGVSVYGQKEMDLWMQRAEDVICAQQDGFQEALKEYHKKKSLGEVLERRVSVYGKEWKIVGIQSDNIQMNAALRYREGAGAGVVVQLNSHGNLLITTNRKSGIRLDDVAGILRYKIQEERGRVVTSDFRDLKKDGVVTGAEELFFHKPACKIYVGSLTYPEVSINLDFKTIFYSVYLGLDRGFFHPNFASGCRRGKCVYKKCDFFPFGRGVCRSIRYHQAKKRKR